MLNVPDNRYNYLMEIKNYKKEFIYSYSLGAFPTIELIKHKKEYIIDIYIHSSFKNEEVLSFIKENINKDKIKYNDKLINKLSPKENCFVIGIFNKYDTNLDKNKNHILLDNPANMGNLGTIIRSSLGFDILNLAIIKPGVDIFDPKVIRASMGAIFSINFKYFSSLEEYKSAYKEHEINAFMLQTNNTLDSFKFTNNLHTLTFGNEATGLDKKYLDNNSIIIKHSKNIDSLNITNAVSIALYEFRKQIKNN